VPGVQRREIAEVGRRDRAHELVADGGKSLPDHHQATRIVERERTEENGIDHREDGRVDANA